MTVCYYHVTYGFQGESTLCSYLNVKELLAQNSRDIWCSSDSNGIRIHNQFVRNAAGFESCCCHLHFRYRTYFKREVSLHSDNNKV